MRAQARIVQAKQIVEKWKAAAFQVGANVCVARDQFGHWDPNDRRPRSTRVRRSLGGERQLRPMVMVARAGTPRRRCDASTRRCRRRTRRCR